MNKIQFLPSVWGGAAWKFLHCVALSYPTKPTQQDRNDYKNFFLSLDKILPCETCSKHFIENKKTHDINKYLNNPHDLFSWTVKIRNEVQKILGKPLHDEIKLRESLYTENVRAGGFLDINPKVKLLFIIALIIGGLYAVSKFFNVKITQKK